MLQFALELVGDGADPRYRTAVGSLKRPLSTGKQTYPTKPDDYPITQPIPKIESMAQCTGDAKFVSDARSNDLLHVAFALATQGNADITKIDKKDAEAVTGVIKVSNWFVHLRSCI